ncbi:MAG: hypothetical protein KJ044_01940, partial [Planctomycetes bacterium]|nr:hypothetical protein [Planctomycetota bacterium]
MRIALLCLLLCAPLAAGEKTDAAVKRLGEQLEKIGKEQAQRRPPRKVAENGWEAFVKFCNDTDALDGDDDHDWKDALYDPTQDFTTHNPETARLALEKTAGIPAQVAALARLPRIVMIPDPKVEPSKQIPVLPMLEAFRFALGRVVLLAESGQHDAARAEARNLAALVGKLDLRASSLGMLAESGMRGSVL